MIKLSQIVDPYRNQIGSGGLIHQMLDAIRKGRIRGPIRQRRGILPDTDWDRKNALLESKNPGEIDTRLPPPPIMRSGPGGRYFSALARSWGASPELVKSMAPPPIRFDREGVQIP